MSVTNVIGDKVGSIVDINSVSVDTLGWDPVESTNQIQSWGAKEHHAVLSKFFFAEPAELPSLTNLKAIRDHYRKLILQSNGGIIHVEATTLRGFDAIETLLKVAVGPNRAMCYLGSYTIPFKNCTFVIKIQAEESGVAGLRAAVMADKYLRAGKAQINAQGGLDNWLCDPYEPAFDKGYVMNQGEKEEYDTLFPTDPLTIVRNTMRHIRETVKFDEIVATLQKFKGK